MLHLPRTLKLEGQEFIYNEGSKTVVLEITQPFISAGKKLGWDISAFGVPGLGINRSIVEFVKQTKSKLLIRVLSNGPGQTEYWMNYDQLFQFIKNNPCQYPVSGKTIFVIPWLLFTSKPKFPGAQS